MDQRLKGRGARYPTANPRAAPLRHPLWTVQADPRSSSPAVDGGRDAALPPQAINRLSSVRMAPNEPSAPVGSSRTSRPSQHPLCPRKAASCLLLSGWSLMGTYPSQNSD